MAVSVPVALLISLLVGVWFTVGALAIGGGFYTPLILGFCTGLLVGNPQLGLTVGAECTLFSMGFYTYGGATTPDYNVGAVFGVIVANSSGSVDQGIIIGTVIALLMSWFDVLGRATTTVFQHGGDAALAKNNIKEFELWHWLGTLPWILCRTIPVFIGFLVINQYEAVSTFVNTYAWLQKGLSVVGGALPAVGFALLLSFMDIKHYWPFMLIGYVCFAYMGVGTVGLAILGCCFGGLFAAKKNKKEEA